MLEPAPLELFPELTETQRIVIAGFTSGKTAKEVGRVLGKSYRTVEYQRERIRERLGCCPHVEAARRITTYYGVTMFALGRLTCGVTTDAA